jgi:hypothetical protein
VSTAVSGWLPQGAPYVFNPLDLSPALWLDAADTTTITASGSPAKVSQWNDKSGNARHVAQATGAAQPTTGSATLNGLNVLDFDGNDRLFASTLSGLPSGATTMFVVAERAAAGNLGCTACMRQAASGTPVFSHFNFTFIRRNDADSLFFSAASSNTGWQYITLYYDGTNLVHRNNGSQVAASTQSGSATFDHISVGASPYIGGSTTFSDIGAFFTGKIAEVVILPSASTAARDLMETYLATKWAI